MCKKTSIVLSAVFSWCLLLAQEYPKVEFGIHGGPGASLFFNEQPMKNPRNVHRPVYNSGLFGAYYQYNFNRMAALHIETNYERKGDIYYNIYTRDRNNVFRHSYAFDRINYVTLPVTCKLSFGRNVRFFVNAGLYAGLQVGSRRVMGDTWYVPAGDVTLTEEIWKEDITKDVSSLDGGVVTGLGVFLPAGKRMAFTIEARNSTGFASQNANTGLYQNKFYNSSTLLLLGLTFAIDKPFPKPEARAKKVKGQPVREMK